MKGMELLVIGDHGRRNGSRDIAGDNRVLFLD
jgi:hypothetical protein